MQMTSTEAQPENDGLTQLSSVLNKLAGRGLTIGEAEDQRKQLSTLSANFKGASVPAAEKLAEVLPKMTDYGARWIAARMLRDFGLKNETEGAFALKAICDVLETEKSAGARYMFCNLLRDLGLAHEGLALTAATAVAETVEREKDSEALMSQKAALKELALKYEAASHVAVAGLSAAQQNSTDPYARILLSSDLRDIALKHPVQSCTVIAVITDAAQARQDSWVTQHATRHIAPIALQFPGSLLMAATMQAAAAGVARAEKLETVFAWSNLLGELSKADPMLGLIALKNGLRNPVVMAHKDKRRAYICNLSALAEAGTAEAGVCSGMLLDILKQEPDAHQRRLAIKGLMACVHNKINPKAVKQGLKDLQLQEKDPETRETLARALRSLGYIRPVQNLVPVALTA